MNIRVFSHFIEIAIQERDEFLNTLYQEVVQHFGQDALKKLEFSAENQERFLRRILCLSDCQVSIEELLASSHLPIRLRVIANKGMQTLQVYIALSETGEVSLRFDQRARSILLEMFWQMVDDVGMHWMTLKHSRENFWQDFFARIQKRKVGQFWLDWRFEQNDLERLKSYYAILDSQVGDDYASVKKNYKRLVRQYHPDQVFGQEVAQNYHRKFLLIQQAFEAIKGDFAKIHTRS